MSESQQQIHNLKKIILELSKELEQVKVTLYEHINTLGLHNEDQAVESL